MPEKLKPEDLKQAREMFDAFELAAEKADVAAAEARRSKGELDRLMRHLHINYDARDDLVIDPVTGEWIQRPMQPMVQG